MPTQTLTLTLDFYLEECCACGVRFAIPTTLREQLRETHRTFYCPNGHGQSYSGKTKAERLAEELEQTKRALVQAENARLALDRTLYHEVQAHTRLKKRIDAGVCPCCNRTFANLARHMKTQHQQQLDAPGKSGPRLLTQ